MGFDFINLFLFLKLPQMKVHHSFLTDQDRQTSLLSDLTIKENFGSSGASMTSSKHSAGYSWLVFQQVLELLYAVPYITICLGEAKNNDIELVSTKFKET